MSTVWPSDNFDVNTSLNPLHEKPQTPDQVKQSLINLNQVNAELCMRAIKSADHSVHRQLPPDFQQISCFMKK
jgi:hypothetical protein